MIPATGPTASSAASSSGPPITSSTPAGRGQIPRRLPVGLVELDRLLDVVLKSRLVHVVHVLHPDVFRVLRDSAKQTVLIFEMDAVAKAERDARFARVDPGQRLLPRVRRHPVADRFLGIGRTLLHHCLLYTS